MTTFTDTIKLLVTADGTKAVSEIERVGKTAQRQLDATGKATRDWSATLTKTGAGLVAFSAVGAAALYKAGQAASDLSEAVNASAVTFGGAQDKIEAFAASAAQGFGQSKKSAHDAAIQFGAFAKAAGFTQGKAADFSIELTSLASDLASFRNTSPEEAVIALGAALRGENEQIRRYGVFLSDAEVRQEAVRLGLGKTTSTVSEAAKIQARYSLVMQRTKDAQGDFARTSDGLANQQRILNAEFENAKASLGQAALPAMTAVTSAAGDMLEKFNSLSPATQDVIGKVASIAVIGSGVVGALSLIAGQVLKVRSNLTELAATAPRTFAALRAAALPLTGIFAALSAVEILKAFEPASYGVDRFTTALEVLNKEQKVGGVLADAFGNNMEDLGDKIDLALNKRLIGGSAALSTLLDGFSNRGRTEVLKAANAFGDLDDALTELTKSGPKGASSARDLFDQLQRKIPKEQWKELNDLLPEYAAAQKDASLAGRAGAFQLDENSSAAERLSTALARAAGAWTKFSDRLGKREKLRDAARAQLDVADATDRVRQAQEEYNRLAADGATSQNELAAAGRDLQRATLDYYSTVDKSTKSVLEAAAATARYKLGQDNGRGATERFRAALVRQRDETNGPLRDSIDNYIKTLGRIPPEKATRISAPGLSEVAQGLVGLKGAIDNIPNRKEITVVANGLIGLTGTLDGKRASGGPVTGGKTYLVGEKGPELFVPASSGSIVPNHRLARGGTPVAGGQVVINFLGPVAGSKREFERMVANAIKEARRRGDRDVA